MSTPQNKSMVPFLRRMITLCVFFLSSGLLMHLLYPADDLVFIANRLLTGGIACLLSVPLILLLRFANGYRQEGDMRMVLWIILMIIFLFGGTGILYLFDTA